MTPIKKTKRSGSKRERYEISPGRPIPLGTCEREGGINFALFSRHATKVWLQLFDQPQDAEPAMVVELDPRHHRTGDIWHVWIAGLKIGQLYAYRADGPYLPEEGHRFNPKKLLLDPYATALAGTAGWDFSLAQGYDASSPLKDLSRSTKNNAHATAKCLLTETRFDWRGDRPVKHPWSKTVIYETHLRGFTIAPGAGVTHPGTFLGLVEKIPYFEELGVTAVELMPVQEFNENELELENPLTGEKLRNYWGYSTLAFFAPKEGYASGGTPGCQVSEFKTMVRELHRAGIEVILDIVFNHTAEGDELGPTLSFRGLDNHIYYMLDGDRRRYRNYSGCGNTLNCNHPVVRSYILDCLRYWVTEMHVDGFRFDLASVLGRDQNGDLLSNPPLLERIAEDPILRDVKIVAEAWDAGGANQVGSFPGRRWSEWNGHFRDDVRRFWGGEPGMAGLFASRICGSADLYQRTGKEPLNSINFITCHDGFTLYDLVTYRHKHNEANGEENQDGTDDNYSDNYGIEGETSDPAIRSIRLRQIKNMLATLFISRGVPMLLGGDEFRRTQHGNNNAYCQDNDISWHDWSLLRKNQEVFRFTREMIAFRKRHRVLRKESFYSAEDILWFGPDGAAPDWEDPGNSLGCMIHPAWEQGGYSGATLCLIFNGEQVNKTFVLPNAPGKGRWRLAVDTALPFPEDIREAGEELQLEQQEAYLLQARSMVILLCRD